MSRKAKLKLLLVILMAWLLESVTLPVAFHDLIRPDLFLIVLVFFAFYLHREKALGLALILGLIKDLFSNGLFGIEMFSLGLAGLFLSWVAKKFDRENVVVISASTWIASSIALLVAFLFHVSHLNGTSTVFLALGKMFLISVYTTLCSWPAVKLLQRLMGERTRQLEFRF